MYLAEYQYPRCFILPTGCVLKTNSGIASRASPRCYLCVVQITNYFIPEIAKNMSIRFQDFDQLQLRSADQLRKSNGFFSQKVKRKGTDQYFNSCSPNEPLHKRAARNRVHMFCETDGNINSKRVEYVKANS